MDGQGQKAASLDEATIRMFASQITGRVVSPPASGYESSRQVFNRAFDLHPALIVRCASSSDVARALEFAQSRNLVLAVHGGGHSRLANGMCDGGLVIDLSGMKSVKVDPSKRVARAEAGVLVRDLDEATRDSLQPFAYGVYVNQLGDTSDQLVRSGYGPNYGRLAEIKKKYDPNNVLRLNQNIKPV
ncbi:MAG TPA: FAD-dependent oxidoreductase [Candidatus Acidoferrales bacterium]|nr:FAD-dependent oxidoreductase [Candidatus Acidoferrales bacterium]